MLTWGPFYNEESACRLCSVPEYSITFSHTVLLELDMFGSIRLLLRQQQAMRRLSIAKLMTLLSRIKDDQVSRLS